MISRHQLGNAYPIKKLESIVEFLDHRRRPVTESDRKPGPYPYYGANGQQGWIDNFLFDEPLVLLAEDGGHFDNPERGVAYLVNGKTWVNNHAHVLRPSNEIDVKFLCRVLENYDLSPFITGTTRGKLTKGGAAEIPVPVPPLEEQRRIAAILDQAETLRTQRRTALALLDSLTQSLFLDMFGDPVANPKGLPICELQRLCTRITDGTHQSPAWQKSGIPFLFISNIVEGQINFDTHKFISADTHTELTKRCPIEIGDVLYTTVGSYGNAAVVSTKELFAFQRHIAHIKPDRSKLDSRFLAAMIQSPGVRQQVDKVAKGIAQKTVNLADLKGLSVFWPPLPLQQIFATRIASIEALKATHRRALAALDALFASLQQRAFTGAL